MKAIVRERYGSPEVLAIKEIDEPAAAAEEVLLRVRAAALNPLDGHNLRGLPYPLRLGNGLTRPKSRVLGIDAAGTVEAVGSAVSRFRTGDEVFGFCDGALAEYACAREDRLAPKPAGLSYEQAAAAPVAALTALQGLRDRGRIRPGQNALIVGASGGVGTFAVQIARWLGASVTGVCSTRNVELVRSLGAAQVVDYTREDFTRTGKRYEVILDMAGTRSLSECRRALTPRGTYIVVGAPFGRWFKGMDRFGKALVLSLFVSQRMVPFITRPSETDLSTVKELLENETIKPVIDRSYALDGVPEAFRHLEEGHVRGKLVISF
jgi:NADPH:quinone reductase-like Zn-dependent oxidoreductase